jgi:phosphohistidine phosphatase
MKVYLMQHALAYPAEEDRERPLSPAGVAQAKAAAKVIKRLGLNFDLIVASPKRRAHQTAALIAEGIRYPHSDILTSEAILPDQLPQDLLDLLQKEATESQILVIGHMPQLAKLARELMQGGELLIENAGLTCINILESESGRLEFHLRAEQLAL